MGLTIPGRLCAAGILAVLVALAASPITAPATAQGMGQHQFKRTILMGSNYSSLRKLDDAVGEANFAEAGKHAQKLTENAKALDGLWPKGTGGPDTAAKPVIWQDRAGFLAALAAFRKSAESAAAAGAANIEVLRQAAKKTRQSCDSCHRAYRTF
jgi:cytochrome c556